KARIRRSCLSRDMLRSNDCQHRRNDTNTTDHLSNCLPHGTFRAGLQSTPGSKVRTRVASGGATETRFLKEFKLKNDPSSIASSTTAAAYGSGTPVDFSRVSCRT